MTPITVAGGSAESFKGRDTDRDDLFAATPPLEAKRSLIAMAACQRGVPPIK